MKKTTKIITIVLSCLLLIGVMVGISVSAAEDTTIAIAKKSVSYEGAVRITYALDVKNLNGGIIKVAFSDEEMAAPQGKLDELGYDFIGGVETYYDIGGVTYPVVCSDGFAPALFTKPVYATPVVVDADGNVVAYGATELFSIFQYCTERFSGSFTADQYELYTALLRYGASVQEALVGSPAYTQAELDKYGYADAYYVVNATVKVDGAAVATETLCYREADVTLNPAKTYNGKMFAGFADAEGNAIGAYGADKTASSWNYCNATLEIGANNFTYNYKTAGALQTWTDANGNDLILGGKNLTHPGSEHSAVTFDKGSDTILSMDVVDGEFVLDAPKTSTWRPLEFVNKNNTKGTVGGTYVFETDLKIVDDYSTAGTDGNLILFGFNKRADYGVNEETFALFGISRTSSTNYKLQTLDKTGGDWANLYLGLEFGKYYNIRIEYKIESIGTTSTTPANSTAKGVVSLYIDGELVKTFTATGYYNNVPNGTFAGVGMLDRAYKGVSDHTYYFDNTYIATE